MPILLLLIALLGVRNHVVRDQSSWQGASFGMFATYDNAVSRQVIVTVREAGDLTRVAVPGDLADEARRLRVSPSAAGARSLAELIATRVGGRGGTEVTVTVWGPVVDDTGGGLRLRFEVLVEEHVRV